jgi:transaldolase
MSAVNPLLEVASLGQSIWMDFLDRRTIASGGLQRLIERDGLRGVTSNPTILQKAIAEHDYDQSIDALAAAGRDASSIYLALAVDDVQHAADVLRPVYDRLDGRDGFVSLEVSPRLAHDTRATVTEARALWAAVDRPNVMIKVPATREGVPAIRDLIADGVNVNVTLLFGLDRYARVAEAHLAGLEARAERGLPLGDVASVASFFLSRIDVLVDGRLEAMQREGDGDVAGLVGKTAIASARTAYQMFKRLYSSDRYMRLASLGARRQRLLWASTSTKNPAYSDVKYVEALIGRDTINTMPPETLDAYRDHGAPAARLELDLADAALTLDRLRRVGIDLDEVTQELEDQGVEKFAKSYDQLLHALERRTGGAAQPAAPP